MLRHSGLKPRFLPYLSLAILMMSCVVACAASLHTPWQKPWQKEGRHMAPSTYPGFNVTSPVLKEGTPIPAKYTCDGQNVMPPLSISGVPPKTRTLALIIEDPDAPSGLFTHLLIWNISPRLRTVTENQLPEGTIGSNDFGDVAYGGPCPPAPKAKQKHPEHHYYFRVLALNSSVTLPKYAKRVNLDEMLNGLIIGETSLMATYQRTPADAVIHHIYRY